MEAAGISFLPLSRPTPKHPTPSSCRCILPRPQGHPIPCSLLCGLRGPRQRLGGELKGSRRQRAAGEHGPPQRCPGSYPCPPELGGSPPAEGPRGLETLCGAREPQGPSPEHKGWCLGGGVPSACPQLAGPALGLGKGRGGGSCKCGIVGVGVTSFRGCIADILLQPNPTGSQQVTKPPPRPNPGS